MQLRVAAVMHVSALVPVVVSKVAAVAVAAMAKETDGEGDGDGDGGEGEGDGVTNADSDGSTCSTDCHRRRILRGPQAFPPLLPEFLSCRSVVRREALLENVRQGDAGLV